ncbi:hypothetical protein BGX26_005127 [Mortierella sp. AD094]|nr:hypothetical protein BGX26_005127 [Mortierella sp. AD094]
MTSAKYLHTLIEDKWHFLGKSWPVVEIAKNHRTVPKEVGLISHIKDTLHKRLGAIPIYFFLTTIWLKCKCPGPYREVEKGLLLLYSLVKGLSMEEMAPFIPRSSYHAIHAMFHKKEYTAHNKYITTCLSTMFSTITIRLIAAKEKNPPLFQHVTFHIDGHDTRATYEGESQVEMYSYKLKKAGLRTQVAMDCNGMALWVSKSASCKSNVDGTMLLAMKLDKKMHAMDCVTVDGGYTQFLKKLVDETVSDLKWRLSLVTLALFSRDTTIARQYWWIKSKRTIYSSSLSWKQEVFEYPCEEGDVVEQLLDHLPLDNIMKSGKSMSQLQQDFLAMQLGDEDVTMDAPEGQSASIVIEIPPVRCKRKAKVASAHHEEDEDL